VAHRAGAVPALLRCAQQMQDAAAAAAAGSPEADAALIAAARAARALLASPDGRAAFLEARGPELSQALLRSASGQAGGALAAAVGALAEAASFKSEENKCRWGSGGPQQGRGPAGGPLSRGAPAGCGSANPAT
jgi:hypothetical protein